jgi:hypothetical protein
VLLLLGFTERMTWRERLLGFGTSAAAIANAPRVRRVAQLLLVAGLVFVLVRVRTIWHESHVDLGRVGWGSLVVAAALAACGLTSSALIWLGILRGLGVATRTRWIGVFFQAQLGKYIPGSVWQYAGRTALARANGIPVREATISLPLEFAGSMLGAVILTLLVFGWWASVVLPVVVLGASIALRTRRRRGEVARGPWGRGARVTLWATPLYVVAWPLSGISFWFVGRAVVGARFEDLPLYAGAFAAAWAVGVIALYAPGGLGVREAVLVAILRSKIGSADALVLAAASRAILAAVDLGLAATGLLLVRGESGRPSPDVVLAPPSPLP